MREDIIRMAQEAGLGESLTHNGGEPRVWIEGADWHDELERFYLLAVAAEREACAQEAEAHASIEGIGQRIAAAIRARWNK